MIILVDGKPAVLKSGSSFDFIAENRLFLGRDSYTLNLTFPLFDCPQNREVFGYANRIEVPKVFTKYDCVIHDNSFVAKGTLIVTGGSEVELKCQFAEGRCEATAKDPFEDVYVNELDLGAPDTAGTFSPMEAWAGIDSDQEAVALPWINESSPTAPNNWVVFENGDYKWVDYRGVYPESMPGSSLSWQPYLIVVAKKICEAKGYSFDFSEWENSAYKYLIICNTVPASWGHRYSDLLPHWTITQFFEKLELLLMGEFDVDHAAQHVSFEFSKNALAKIEPVHIDEVVDTYDYEVSSDDNSCEYLGAKRLAYKDVGHELQPFYACDWFMVDAEIRRYANAAELVALNAPRIVHLTAPDHSQIAVKAYGQPPREGESIRNDGRGRYDSQTYTGYVLYAEAEDTYFVFRKIGEYNTGGEPTRNFVLPVLVLQPVNVFGCGSVESDDVQTEEIDFVPACISDTYVDRSDDMGFMLHVKAPMSSEDESTNAVSIVARPASRIESGEKSQKTEYFDAVSVGFWEGVVPFWGKTPYPLIDSVNVTQDFCAFTAQCGSLRLHGPGRDVYSEIPKVNPKQKFKFSFIADTIPNPRAIFHIRGQRYVCEKITATFTEDGMSELLKGEFYPVVE